DMMRRIRYDLVFMDCMMPEMNGYEATTAIRKLEDSSKDIIIIALTANAQSEERKKCLDIGMNDYLSKPVKKHVLQAMLAKWLKPHAIQNISERKDERMVTERAAADLKQIMDEELFHAFMELFGEKAVSVLYKYCETSKNYVDDIRAGLEKGDFKSVVDAAHPLKSSSSQMGAYRISECA